MAARVNPNRTNEKALDSLQSTQGPCVQIYEKIRALRQLLQFAFYTSSS